MCYVSETEGIIADLAWKGLVQVVKEIFEGGMVWRIVKQQNEPYSQRPSHQNRHFVGQK